MSRATDMTADARVGYDGNDNPHLYSSACWYAHELGRMFHATGRTVPRAVRMGRGYTVHANDMTFQHVGTASAPGWVRLT